MEGFHLPRIFQGFRNLLVNQNGERNLPFVDFKSEKSCIVRLDSILAWDAITLSKPYLNIKAEFLLYVPPENIKHVHKFQAPICSVFNVHVREHASSQTCTTLPKMLTGKTYQQKKMVLLKPTKVDVHPEISVTKRVLTYPLSDRDEALLKNTQSPFGHLLSNPHYEKNSHNSFRFVFVFAS